MFRIHAHKERDRLERKLSNIGKPGWYTLQYTKRIGKLAVMLYAINGGIETMQLINSDAYQSRKALAKQGYSIMTDLKNDEKFHAGVEAYIEAKALVKPELKEDLDAFKKNIRIAAETQDEFLYRIEKVYNPLAMMF